MLSLITLLALSAPALAYEPISPGELRNSAMAIEERTVVLSIFSPSIFSLGPGVDLRSDLLRTLGQPNLALRLGIVDTERFAVALEPMGAMEWTVDRWEAGGVARFTLQGEPNRLHLGVGVRYDNLEVSAKDREISATALRTTIPVHVGCDIIPSDRNTWQLLLDVYPDAFVERRFEYARFGVHWLHAGGEHFRIALGGDLVVAEEQRWDWVDWFEDQSDEDLIGDPPDAIAFPAFHLGLWWRI